MPRSPRRRRSRPASGCSLLRFDGRGGDQQTSRLGRSRRATISRKTRLAFGQRAGLVHHERVDLSSVSRASAFLISTPACAPRPMPTMIDIGVASPSAHGQAMISTATAFTSACAKRGSGPNDSPDDESQRPRCAITAGTKQPATLSASA